MPTPEDFTQRAAGFLPGHLGVVVTHVGPNEVRAELQVRKALMAPNGYLHAGIHLGKTAHVWDSIVTHRETGRTIALFRCTQMVLYAARIGV